MIKYKGTKEDENMIKFTKMQGLGNDYVYIDATKEI